MHALMSLDNVAFLKNILSKSKLDSSEASEKKICLGSRHTKKGKEKYEILYSSIAL